jgi:hypothetical protein
MFSGHACVRRPLFLVIALGWALTVQGEQTKAIDEQSAISLSDLSLYPDSTFFEQRTAHLPGSTLFRVLQSSDLQHEDADQRQRFRWFRVRAVLSGIEGWAFGDALAVCVPSEQVDDFLRPFHFAHGNYGNGFRNATTWLASVQGSENTTSRIYMNPIYYETYLIVTNERGKSVQIPCCSNRTLGYTNLRKIVLADVTKDGVPDFILEKDSASNDATDAVDNLEIYSMQAGRLSLIFEEQMNLTIGTDRVPSPAISKFVEIEPDNLRTAYVDFVPDGQQQILAMQYVAATLVWDNGPQRFVPLYDPARTGIEGMLRKQTVLYQNPSYGDAVLDSLAEGQPLTLVGQSLLSTDFFFVRTANGSQGYLPAADFVFPVEVEHAALLEQYYRADLAAKGGDKPHDFLLLYVPVQKIFAKK